MRSALAALVTIAILVTSPPVAAAVTIRDIIELSRAGLSAEVLIALIETDGSRFDLGPSQILELKAASVRDEVIIAMLRSGRDDLQQAVEASPPADARGPSMAAEREKRKSWHGRRRSDFAGVPVPLFMPFVPLYAFHGFHGQVIQGHIPPSTFDPSQFSSFGTGFGRQGDRRNLSTCLSPGSCLLSPDSFNEPVYWGWGGKRRPDTWGQPAPDRAK